MDSHEETSAPIWFETRWGIALLAAALIVAGIILLCAVLAYLSWR